MKFDDLRKMCDVMVEYQKSYIGDNIYIYEQEVRKLDLIELGKRQLEYLLETVLNYPGIEVYRI